MAALSQKHIDPGRVCAAFLDLLQARVAQASPCIAACLLVGLSGSMN